MSYDAKQMAAVLTRCLTCGEKFYMTDVRMSCVLCLRKRAQSTPELHDEASGSTTSSS
jgi:formylmethanofuran dehydrogenase subunit E